MNIWYNNEIKSFTHKPISLSQLEKEAHCLFNIDEAHKKFIKLFAHVNDRFYELCKEEDYIYSLERSATWVYMSIKNMKQLEYDLLEKTLLPVNCLYEIFEEMNKKFDELVFHTNLHNKDKHKKFESKIFKLEVQKFPEEKFFLKSPEVFCSQCICSISQNYYYNSKKRALCKGCALKFPFEDMVIVDISSKKTQKDEENTDSSIINELKIELALFNLDIFDDDFLLETLIKYDGSFDQCINDLMVLASQKRSTQLSLK